MYQKINYVLNRYKPLCCVPDGIIVYHKRSLYQYKNGKLNMLLQLKSGLKSYLCESSRLLERIMRGEPKCGVYSEGYVYIALGNGIFQIDPISKTIKAKTSYRKNGIHTSRITQIQDVSGFDNCLSYGEYFDNPKREEACVFIKKQGGDSWEKVYTFPSGTIRHIHTLVPDTTNNCVYIFTGDSDSESGIWRATNMFRCVEPLLVGNQDYRACIGYVDGESLIFATDVPSRQNKIVSYNIRPMK